MEFENQAEFESAVAHDPDWVERELRTLKQPANQLAAFYREALAPWRNGLLEAGLEQAGGKADDVVPLWLIVSAVVALRRDKGTSLSAAQTYSLAGTSPADGRRKLNLAEEVGLVTWEHPVVAGKRNKKFKFCAPTKLSERLYDQQVLALKNGFGKSLVRYEPSLEATFKRRGILGPDVALPGFGLPPETRG